MAQLKKTTREEAQAILDEIKGIVPSSSPVVVPASSPVVVPASSPVVVPEQTEKKESVTPLTTREEAQAILDKIKGTVSSSAPVSSTRRSDDPNIFGTGALGLVSNKESLAEQSTVPTSERRYAIPIVTEDLEEPEILFDTDPAVDDPTLVKEEFDPFGTGALSLVSDKEDLIAQNIIPTSEEADAIPFDYDYNFDELTNRNRFNTLGSSDNFNFTNEDGNLIGYSVGQEFGELSEKLYEMTTREPFPEGTSDKEKAEWGAKKLSYIQNNFVSAAKAGLQTADTDYFRELAGIDPDVSLEDQLFTLGRMLEIYGQTKGGGKPARFAAEAIALDPVNWGGVLIAGGLKAVAKITGSKKLANLPLNFIKRRLAIELAKKGLTKKEIQDVIENGARDKITERVFTDAVKQVTKLTRPQALALAGGYTGSFNVLEQNLKTNVGLQEDFNLGELAQQTLVGTAFYPLVRMGSLPTVAGARKKLAAQQKEASFIGPKLPSEKVVIEPTPKEKNIKDPLKRNVIVEGLGSLNSWLGRGLRSDAGLVAPMLKAAREFNRPKVYTQMRLINKRLDKAVKGKNINDDTITEYMETGVVGDGKTLDNEVTEVLDDYRKTIFDNQTELNELAGLQGKAELGSQYTYDPKTKRGTIYYTRSYESVYDPRFVAQLTRKLRGKRLVGITGGERKRNQRVEEAIDAGRSYYIKQLQANLANKKQGLKLSDENALDAEQIKVLTENSDNVILTKGQLKEIDGQIQSFVNHVSHADEGLGLESWLNPLTHTDNISKVLRRRNEKLDPQLRKLLGETTDPFLKLKETLKNQNDVISRAKYISDLDSFLKSVAARSPDKRYIEIGGILPFNLGPKKRISVTSTPQAGVSGTRSLEEYAQKLLGQGRAGQTDLMKGLYTSKKMFKLIDNNINMFNRNNISGTWKILQGVASAAQASQTLFDVPTAYLLNTIGSIQGLAINGVFLQPVKTFRNTGKTALMFYRSVKNNNPKALELFDFLRKEGVIEAGIVAEPIIRNVSFMDNPAQIFSGKGLSQLPLAAYKKIVTGLGKAYGSVDAFGKTILFFNELDGLKKAFPKLLTENGEPTQELLELAAKRTTDNFWTYSRAAPIARELARVPIIGNYVLFPSEGIRMHKNVIVTSATDVVQGLSRARQGEAGGVAQVQMGLRRVAGLTAMGYGVDSYVRSNNQERGVDENDLDVIDILKPPYYTGKQVLILNPIPEQTTGDAKLERLYKSSLNFVKNSEDEAGIQENEDGDIVVRYLVSPSFDAFDVTKDPARIAMEFLSSALSGENINPKELGEKTERAMKNLIGSYISPKFATQFFLDILASDRSSFDPLFERSDKENIKLLGEKFLKGNLLPGAKDTVLRAIEVLDATDPEKLKQDRRKRAVNNYGSPVAVDDYLTWLTTGMKPQSINLNQRMALKTYKDLNRIGLTQANFRNFMRNLPAKIYTTETETSILNEYAKLQVRRLELLQDVGKDIAKYKSLNYKEYKKDGKGKDKKYGNRIFKDMSKLFNSKAGQDLALVSTVGKKAIDNKDQTEKWQAYLKEGLLIPDQLSSSTVVDTMFMSATQKIPEEYRRQLISKLGRMQKNLMMPIQNSDPFEVQEMLNNLIKEMQE